MLGKRLSPDQVSGRLKVVFPDNDRMRISHESIYRSIYVYPRGELARELKATLAAAGPCAGPAADGRQSRILGPVSIAERPEEVDGRQVPGHHEGDLILGGRESNSAVATIVERHSGYLTLRPRARRTRCRGRGRGAVAEAMSALPDRAGQDPDLGPRHRDGQARSIQDRTDRCD